MSTVREIISTKGNSIWSVSPQHMVYDTLKLMAEKNVGAVIVLEGDQIVGIFSERDFARHVLKTNVRLEQIPIKDMMTTKVLFVGLSQSTEECMSLMTSKHIRHLPVLEDGKLVGLISIGDVVNRIIKDHQFSISQLERYVTGG